MEVSGKIGKEKKGQEKIGKDRMEVSGKMGQDKIVLDRIERQTDQDQESAVGKNGCWRLKLCCNFTAESLSQEGRVSQIAAFWLPKKENEKIKGKLRENKEIERK